MALRVPLYIVKQNKMVSELKFVYFIIEMKSFQLMMKWVMTNEQVLLCVYPEI